MDQNPNEQHYMLKLISVLETLVSSTHQSKISIQAHSGEARSLLHGWILPETEPVPDSLPPCLCVEAQTLSTFLEKVDKAVKYSQSVREGRSDLASPWQDDEGNSIQKPDGKILISTKNVLPPKGLGYTREKIFKGRPLNGPSKKFISGLPDSQSKTLNVSEKQDQTKIICPLHGNPDESIKTKHFQSVGLAEALDVKGIPPELVTILKSVHHHINRLKTNNLKNKLETSFVKHLNAVNEPNWENFSSFSVLFENLRTTPSKKNVPTLRDGNISYTTNSGCTDKHLLNGIWNSAIDNIISVGALCVQYQNEEMWHLLHKRIQLLQLAQAEWQVCNVLSCNPLLCNPSPEYRSASLFLKAATAMSHLTTLNLPVLVQTFRDP